jgi:hypothetical protein
MSVKKKRKYSLSSSLLFAPNRLSKATSNELAKAFFQEILVSPIASIITWAARGPRFILQ